MKFFESILLGKIFIKSAKHKPCTTLPRVSRSTNSYRYHKWKKTKTVANNGLISVAIILQPLTLPTKLSSPDFITSGCVITIYSKYFGVAGSANNSNCKQNSFDLQVMFLKFLIELLQILIVKKSRGLYEARINKISSRLPRVNGNENMEDLGNL